MEFFTLESPDSPTFELEEGLDFESGKEDTISIQSVQSTQVKYCNMLLFFNEKSSRKILFMHAVLFYLFIVAA